MVGATFKCPPLQREGSAPACLRSASLLQESDVLFTAKLGAACLQQCHNRPRQLECWVCTRGVIWQWVAAQLLQAS